MIPSRTRTLATLFASVLALAATAPVALAGHPKDFVGIESQDTFAAAEEGDLNAMTTNLSAQAATGIRIHRQWFNWDHMEPTRGNYNFTVTDRYMLKMAAHGQKVLPILFDSPRFYQRRGDVSSRSLYFPPRSGRPLGRFGAALIKRYGPRGSFWRGKPAKYRRNSAIRSWQIWNEPNLPKYWGNRPNPRQYVAVLRGAYRVMKRAHRRAEIVSAGIPQSSIRRSIPAVRYLRAMYRWGLKRVSNTVAYNAYARNPRDMFRKLRAFRAQMRRSRDARTRLWLTEMGWATGGNRSPFRTTRARQARYIRGAVTMLGRQRRRMRLRGFVYFQWRDVPPYNEGRDHWGLHTGLIDRRDRFKPGYRAFKRAVLRLR